MKEIREKFKIKLSATEICVIARNRGMNYLETGKLDAADKDKNMLILYPNDLRFLGKRLLVIADKIDNDPDFNESKSKESPKTS